MALLFVLVPLLVYVPMFAYETSVAFRRIGKPVDHGGAYLHATWEVTHTFLILSVNYFMWLYSSAIVAVAQAAFIPLVILAAAFLLRAVLYLDLFYLRPRDRRSGLEDRVFAWLHVLIAGCVLATGAVALTVMIQGSYQPNDALLGLVWPGLLLMISLVSLPLLHLYRPDVPRGAGRGGRPTA